MKRSGSTKFAYVSPKSFVFVFTFTDTIEGPRAPAIKPRTRTRTHSIVEHE